MATTEKHGYVNGSDILLVVEGLAIGSCTEHTTTFNAETKERAVKDKLHKGMAAGKWKRKSIVGMSYSVSFSGLRFYDETEYGYKKLLKAFKEGKSIEIQCLERSAEDNGTLTPYLKGLAVLTSLSESDGAGDDATYNGTFENDGEPSILDESKITEGTLDTPLA